MAGVRRFSAEVYRDAFNALGLREGDKVSRRPRTIRLFNKEPLSA